ncbi:MAG: Endonuclease/exonuclease/phosphatase [Acidobacteria bacterium]|jgi:endonuclease/exonuclease/phosphatase (EEP) superfamily protein YafD|nr:Endonuclease/exonuclease/phosphatase [Acidobacteriota bacterium]
MEIFLFAIETTLYLLAILAINLTVLPFLKFHAWWIRIGEFPRLQIAGVCLIVLIFLPFLVNPLSALEITFLLFVGLCAAYQFYCVVRYLPFYPKQVERSRVPLPKNVIKLFICNVLIDNRDTEKLLRQIEKNNPDLILLAEVDDFWTENIAEIEKRYPHFVKCPLDNAYGMALYSRLQLKDAELKFLVEDDIPSIHTKVTLPSGKLINLYCLHPRPPVPTENVRSLERDAELLMVGRMIDKHDEPTIVAGDLNDVAWSRTTKLFQKISGLLDPRVGRGLYSTFPVAHPLVRCPLDHVFHSNHFRLVELRRLKSVNSDHFPMYISLALEKTAEYTQVEPEAEPEEKLEAVETIKDALETLQAERAEK